MGAMKEPTVDLYRADYYAWVNDQTDALKQRDFGRLDLANLIEEVESLGKSHESEMESRTEVLLMQLLKWQHQPTKRGKSWRATIVEQRLRLRRLFKHMPSLRAKWNEYLQQDYEDAWVRAVSETELDRSTFPVDCPYTVEQIMDVDWLPPALNGPHTAGAGQDGG